MNKKDFLNALTYEFERQDYFEEKKVHMKISKDKIGDSLVYLGMLASCTMEMCSWENSVNVNPKNFAKLIHKAMLEILPDELLPSSHSKSGFKNKHKSSIFPPLPVNIRIDNTLSNSESYKQAPQHFGWHSSVEHLSNFSNFSNYSENSDLGLLCSSIHEKDLKLEREKQITHQERARIMEREKSILELDKKLIQKELNDSWRSST